MLTGRLGELKSLEAHSAKAASLKTALDNLDNDISSLGERLAAAGSKKSTSELQAGLTAVNDETWGCLCSDFFFHN